ncbi:MAG: hypothetical protein COT59_01985 [Candidatus Nealsonbacteria bacterium CG09_land_8_20_14_0_10_42_14]|uniref:Uncharacterized protein n=1 Tax=Candidatus Nealsonbacteria bacterium CG09_land_8_20_14_0_10_42_14 TaxID=1974707 RepID=A0A2H0WX04_9BACT|nr:MAG: hypothetical protein COT59_01985 [Candidatus Nealsonbacteria bacterium CG09_land_8_20_14_0_10_42_14]
MLLTPHILAGVVIATKFPNPVLGLIFAFLSHYFLDLPPQTEYSIQNIKEGRWNKTVPDFLKVLSDIVLGAIVVFLIVGYSPFVLAAAVLAVLPDGITFLSCIFPKNKALVAHQKVHVAINNIGKNKKIPAFWGIFSQIAVIVIAIIFLLR